MTLRWLKLLTKALKIKSPYFVNIKNQQMSVKGKTNNPNGRPKGAKGVKTKAWEELGDFFTKEGAENAMKIINYYGEIVQKEDGSEDFRNADKFLLHYSNLLEYFKPKLARTETKVEADVSISGIKFEDAEDSQS